jgi:ABC-2 type transport system ATP-binding protein
MAQERSSLRGGANAISVRNLTKIYGDRAAVNKISFDVPLGQVCGFVGPNGSGKTTTIRMLLGLVKPTAGRGTILGSDITSSGQSLTKVGAMIEGPAFYPMLSGAENLRVLATLGGIAFSRIPGLLKLVGLQDRGDEKFRAYSLGMKQRLGIAAAMLPRPSLLILDEPTNGLDPIGIQEIRELILRLAADGATVFVSSHILAELEMVSDYLVMLRKGRLLYQGPAKELLEQRRPRIQFDTGEPYLNEEVAQIAQEYGFSYYEENGEFLIEAPADFAGQLNQAAFNLGITLCKLTTMQPTLEETFFEMAGER